MAAGSASISSIGSGRGGSAPLGVVMPASCTGSAASWSRLASAIRAAVSPPPASPCSSCATQAENTRWPSATRANKAGVSAQSSCSQRFSACSTAHAVSPSWTSPTMRPLPLRVWKPRRMVTSCAGSSVPSRSASSPAAIPASTSCASSMKIASSSASISAPTGAAPAAIGAAALSAATVAASSGAAAGARASVPTGSVAACGIAAGVSSSSRGLKSRSGKSRPNRFSGLSGWAAATCVAAASRSCGGGSAAAGGGCSGISTGAAAAASVAGVGAGAATGVAAIAAAGAAASSCAAGLPWSPRLGSSSSSRRAPPRGIASM
jgi:hypothetical protein